jgi:hypothetical protein
MRSNQIVGILRLVERFTVAMPREKPEFYMFIPLSIPPNLKKLLVPSNIQTKDIVS